MDLSSTFRAAIHRNLPQAKIVADRFHVHRILTRLTNRFRKKATGDKRKNPIRKLVLRNWDKLEAHEKKALRIFLNSYPDLREVYEYKEAVNRLYRTKGRNRAARALSNLLDRMARSSLDAIKGIRATLVSWRTEILEFFTIRISNGRVEGFNRRAKLLQRRAYGFSVWENYRLRLLAETAVRPSRR